MTHRHLDWLPDLVSALDHERSRFVIHVDAKSPDFESAPTEAAVTKGRIHWLPRRRVGWGDFTQVACELDLLAMARSHGQHAYYHLLSGSDLPMRPIAELLEFFDRAQMREFIHLERRELWAGRHERYRYFRWAGPRSRPVWRRVDGWSRRGQRFLRIDRARAQPNVTFAVGSQWFSATQQFVDLLLARRRWITRTFSRTICPDEIFVQTVALNWAPDRLAADNARLIDWERGDGCSPYVWRQDDWPTIQASDAIFARKFDPSIDAQVMRQVLQRHQLPGA